MLNWMPLIIIVILSLLGFFKLVLDIRKIGNLREFSVDFVNMFRKLINQLQNNNFDSELYQSLRLKSAEMQTIMGNYGVARKYKPAGANYIYNNYEIVVNGLAEIRNLHIQMAGGFDSSFEKRMLAESASMIDDVLITYIGVLNTQQKKLIIEIKNPFILLREGVRLIVTSPISLIYWSGLIRYRTYDSLSNNIFVKLISVIIGLVGLISSIITIVTGYNPFMDIFNKLILK
ncbi:hypothetical protein ABEP16_13205 [Priestia aryabhattai]|uniref:hypothetical protein n=1 Tax=Priestia aryabhattai TaxID=412384 RepID=UPI003D269E4E